MSPSPSRPAYPAPPGDREQAIAQGEMIISSAVVMTVKNRLIVQLLREQADVDAGAVRSLVYEELGRAIREQRQNADRAERLEGGAAVVRGRATHEHDFRQRDVDILRSRRQIALAVADRLDATRGDRSSLALLGELAVTRAREEIADAAATSTLVTPTSRVGPDYAEERLARISRFEQLDLAALLARATGPTPVAENQR